MIYLDYVLAAISAFCTLFSIIGAYKSNICYKKSKQITIYANINIAFIESQKIIAILTEMLKLGNSTRKRGTNYVKEISDNGANCNQQNKRMLAS